MTTTHFPLLTYNRAERHPAAGFAIAAGIALAALGMTAQAGSGLYNVSAGTVTAVGTFEADVPRATPKTDRLAPASEADRACAGQSWGRESSDCLVAIAKEGGKSDFVRIRTISGA